MSSEKQLDFERYRKMYHNKLKAQSSQNAKVVPSEHPANASSQRVQQSGIGIHVPYPGSLPTVGSISVPVKNVGEKRTYEQVYKDNLEKMRCAKLHFAKEPAQKQYRATIYNVTPHNLSSETQPVRTLNVSATVAPTVPAKPTIELISYQKSKPTSYAKHLVELTKQSMHKNGLVNMEAQPHLMVNCSNANDVLPRNTSVAHASNVRSQINHHHDINTVAAGKARPSSSNQSLSQEEIYRRIQAKQARRDAPNPSVQTFAQNGEMVVISKHRSNIMLSIVNPKISSPAPAHVYGSPGIQTDRAPNSTEQHRSPESGTSTNIGKPTELQHGLGSTSEPPPAHSTTHIADPMNSLFPVAPVAPVMPDSSYKNAVQEGVLNLDMKHCASQSDVSIKSEVVPCTSDHQCTVIKPPPIIQMSSNVVLPNIGNAYIAGTSEQTIRRHLQIRHLKQVFANVKANRQLQQMAVKEQQQIVSTQVEPPMPVAATCFEEPVLNAQQPTHPPNINLAETKHNPTAPVSEIEFTSILPEFGETSFANHGMKRKNTGKERDLAKKRTPKAKHIRPTESYLQNGPCYEVGSRLPRCRECGRSAATRSRHAMNIFCRFFAFRKLKYNDTGRLEVVGFADPYLDPGESDTTLWSSNLQQVPADLSIEKSKFLLGQVGYKFCELFHQEKEAHFEHLSEDKTIAWKQAVRGVREMCDVCQTTLFNHHWVCSNCGFVVCIDCYKYRKHGNITSETASKDKDAHGWLLCTSTKEPHCQNRLMLTQIIPSNCLYKLVRQMHGICALLEIPLNCECPLSKEPLFRKIKDKLEFIYPMTVYGQSVGDSLNGFASPTNQENAKITRMVSITIKSIEQVTHRGDAETDIREPIECKIEFSKQFHENKRQSQCRGGDAGSGAPGNEALADDITNGEKQSYCFDGFQREIHSDGDHFDESLYTIPKVSATDGSGLKLEESNGKIEDNGAETGQIDLCSVGNGNESVVSNCNAVTTAIEFEVGATKTGTIENTFCSNIINDQTVVDDVDANVAINGSDTTVKTPPSLRAIRILEVTPKKENGTQQSPCGGNGSQMVNDIPAAQEDLKPVSYSEAGRFKASPPIDPKTFAMIVKQMVKFDKTIDIFSTFERHMACEPADLADFIECISVQPERVQRFLNDFLDDFVFLRGQNRCDDLTNELQLVEYNRQIKEGVKFRNKGERRMHLNESKTLYPDVAHEWLCNGKLLRLLNPLDVHNYRSFHDQWERGQPVMVSAVSSKMNMDLWNPDSFGRDFGEQVNDLINCFSGKIVRGQPMKVFWEGFERIRERLVDERERTMMLKLKDWPPGDDFAEMMPSRFYDLMKSLPLAEYTRREGRLNLASRLSSFYVRPDLGPKMYSAYGSALYPNKGTTNLHLDMSDAVNVMVYVGVPTDAPRSRYNEKILEVIDSEDCDYLTRERIRKRKELPGALWHIYHAQDADKIRDLLNKIELERGGTIKPNHDQIHDQKWYLDRSMRRRLQQEYGVDGYAIVQCSGDAIFIPAGAPHQVRNLHNCIKVAEDFVSPENISYCFKLTNEFRHLTKTHSNHEDKLQIKNIIFHTVKDAVSCITNPLIMMTHKPDPIEVMS